MDERTANDMRILKTTTKEKMFDDFMLFLREEINRIPHDKLVRKIVIFGAGVRGVVAYEVLKSLGYFTSYFVDSNKEKQTKTFCGLQVHEPANLMYEDFDELLVLIAADFPADIIKTVEGYGLKLNDNVECVYNRESVKYGLAEIGKMHMLDFFLGYNRSADLDGFECLESKIIGQDEKELKILVLGGSTTDYAVLDTLEYDDPDPNVKYDGSWPRIFHDLLDKKGIKSKIYNGGMSGYTSAQELLKLIRDGLLLKPDLVLVLDGVNDNSLAYYHKNKHPKVHSYFKIIDEKILPAILNENSRLLTQEATAYIDSISYGVESRSTALDEWYANQRIMHSVCNEFGIEFFSFLQPGGLYMEDYVNSCEVQLRVEWIVWNFLYTQANTVIKNATTNYSADEGYNNFVSHISDYCKYLLNHDEDKINTLMGKSYTKFCKSAKDKINNTEYLVDISDVLNGYSNVIYDYCHCNYEGNKLIAARIFRELEKREVFTIYLEEV